MAVVVAAPSPQLSLFLSERIPPDQRQLIERLARRNPSVACIVGDEGDGKNIHVLFDFEKEDLPSLLGKKRRVIGLPFAEQIFRDPSCMNTVKHLPLYQNIFQMTVCCSGLDNVQRERCMKLVRWMGGTFKTELELGVDLLITERVSLHPESKYQSALSMNVPVVCMALLEDTWKEKRALDVAKYKLSALRGLSICFDPSNHILKNQYEQACVAHGAQITTPEHAEAVIVADTLAHACRDALKRGLQTCPPRWLDACCEAGLCLLVEGELAVPHPGALLEGDAAEIPLTLNLDESGGTALLGVVICILYVPVDKRDMIKGVAWRCGAFTTLEPKDRAITHVLFHPVTPTGRDVSVPRNEDRVFFVDVSWLHACAENGKRMRVERYPQQIVFYNPEKDPDYARLKGRSLQPASRARPLLRRSTSAAEPMALQNPATLSSSQPVQSPPTRYVPLGGGVFNGKVICLVGWPKEHHLVEKIRMNGGAVLQNGGGEVQADFCVRPFGAQTCACGHRGPEQLRTEPWVEACVADTALLDALAFPHFEPGDAPFPLSGFSGVAVRITCVDCNRKRPHLERMATLVGAKLLGQGSTMNEMTHMICLRPELLDRKKFESVKRKGKWVLTAQWLMDSVRTRVAQPEQKYVVSVQQCKSATSVPEQSRVQPCKSATSVPEQSSTSTRNFATSVLVGYDIFVSLAALGSNTRLPQMAEELGAKVRTWQTAEELRAAVATATSQDSLATASNDSGRQAVVIVEKEEAKAAADSLRELWAAVDKFFVLPLWLLEVFSQRRALPFEAFAAIRTPQADEPAAKRPKIEGTTEAAYVWQHDQTKRLEDLAAASRVRELASKKKERVDEGRRVATLRSDPSQLGA